MSLKHPFVNRSWITYELARDGIITTILHVEPTMQVSAASDLEGALVEAASEYMRQHDHIDRVQFEPRNG